LKKEYYHSGSGEARLSIAKGFVIANDATGYAHLDEYFGKGFIHGGVCLAKADEASGKGDEGQSVGVPFAGMWLQIPLRLQDSPPLSDPEV
jgi:hypothetical protein